MRNAWLNWLLPLLLLGLVAAVARPVLRAKQASPSTRARTGPLPSLIETYRPDGINGCDIGDFDTTNWPRGTDFDGHTVQEFLDAVGSDMCHLPALCAYYAGVKRCSIDQKLASLSGDDAARWSQTWQAFHSWSRAHWECVSAYYDDAPMRGRNRDLGDASLLDLEEKCLERWDEPHHGDVNPARILALIPDVRDQLPPARRPRPNIDPCKRSQPPPRIGTQRMNEMYDQDRCAWNALRESALLLPEGPLLVLATYVDTATGGARVREP